MWPTWTSHQSRSRGTSSGRGTLGSLLRGTRALVDGMSSMALQTHMGTRACSLRALLPAVVVREADRLAIGE
eukprot:6484398-Amphidinium_carterae.2